MKKDDKIHVLDKHYIDFYSMLYVLILIMILGIPSILVFHFFVNVADYPIEIGLILLIVLFLFFGYIVYKIENRLKKKN